MCIRDRARARRARRPRRRWRRCGRTRRCERSRSRRFIFRGVRRRRGAARGGARRAALARVRVANPRRRRRRRTKTSQVRFTHRRRDAPVLGDVLARVSPPSGRRAHREGRAPRRVAKRSGGGGGGGGRRRSLRPRRLDRSRNERRPKRAHAHRNDARADVAHVADVSTRAMGERRFRVQGDVSSRLRRASRDARDDARGDVSFDSRSFASGSVGSRLSRALFPRSRDGGVRGGGGSRGGRRRHAHAHRRSPRASLASIVRSRFRVASRRDSSRLENTRERRASQTETPARASTSERLRSRHHRRVRGKRARVAPRRGTRRSRARTHRASVRNTIPRGVRTRPEREPAEGPVGDPSPVTPSPRARLASSTAGAFPSGSGRARNRVGGGARPVTPAGGGDPRRRRRGRGVGFRRDVRRKSANARRRRASERRFRGRGGAVSRRRGDAPRIRRRREESRRVAENRRRARRESRESRNRHRPGVGPGDEIRPRRETRGRTARGDDERRRGESEHDDEIEIGVLVTRDGGRPPASQGGRATRRGGSLGEGRVPRGAETGGAEHTTASSDASRKPRTPVRSRAMSRRANRTPRRRRTSPPRTFRILTRKRKGARAGRGA